MPEAENRLTTTYWGNLSKVHIPVILISRYQLELPDKDRLRAFIEGQLREVKGK